MSPFVQSCVLCGEHKKFMHDPHLTACPTCGSPYCRQCYSSLPLVKVGLLRKERQCPRCAQASGAARLPYTPYQPQPQYQQPPQPVYVTTQQTKETIKEIVKIPCSYCGTLVEQLSSFCTSCGAPLRR